MSMYVRVALVSILLALTAAYVYLNPPADMAVGGGSLEKFPMVLGDWSGTELSFDEVVTEELNADDTLTRRYTRGVDDVWFVVIFHQNERYGAHEPLVCYRSQGWTVVDQGTRTLRREVGDFDANWVAVESKGQTRLALYWWYTAGDLATGDRDRFMARMAASGILSNVTFGAFVRISTVVRDGDLASAMDTITGFAEQTLVYLPALFEADVGD